MEEFLPLENSSSEPEQDYRLEPDRERIKHLIVGAPKVVKRTIHLLHSLGYAEAKQWSRPKIAGSLGHPGEVVSILSRNVLLE
ncbi:hypothetical protein [Leptolyngbya sp. FACHB-17]|uniref:hypothetical protein n=1 Tax=unclassified Leptolyngbya TaxID=2650499 RepID=UPI00167FFE24|nr:hypothetical protein [Leptolyngbya sp. FACHB-17]MBD2078399.1 hypothetical protein [Leptolyngbya sp. FACHB-17]